MKAEGLAARVLKGIMAAVLAGAERGPRRGPRSSRWKLLVTRLLHRQVGGEEVLEACFGSEIRPLVDSRSCRSLVAC